MVKDEKLYSNAWKPVKITANIIVAIEPYNAPLLSPWIKEWCENVTVAPLDNNITVLSKGNSKGLTGSIPAGGHWAPSSIVGVNALWKNAQKIAKKNKASETINKSTPKFSPFCTARVWFPKKVDLLITYYYLIWTISYLMGFKINA